MSAPESSAKGPAIRTTPRWCNSVSRVRCAARAASRSGALVKLNSTIHMPAPYGDCRWGCFITGYKISLAAISAFASRDGAAQTELAGHAVAVRYRAGWRVGCARPAPGTGHKKSWLGLSASAG
jgi:hypothetical protein